MVIIKAANTSDAELIAELSRKTFYDTFVADNTQEDMDLFLNEQFTSKSLMKEVGQIGNHFFLVYFNNNVVGYVRMRETECHNAFEEKSAVEIARFYVVKEMIGQGIGKAMMEHCIAFAKESKKSIIWLAVWEKNERAIPFYQKFGFEKFGEHAFLLGNDLQTDWEMKLKI